ncbi:L,D-transpeptidase [Phyllobacterium phragmitis]|uniref:L,D-transpeptidase n=1 Tax=Phyllobacterium phragmitis TaxID=2670329 RepID=A0A2S9IUG5_9HYPH|nr:L,D-transpeptidase [Phyllobacterium phragmitis]PRD44158.1 L,D-transpeptidase [Phyllobacterium phragmitis]
MSNQSDHLSRRALILGAGTVALTSAAGCSQTMDMSALQMNIDPMPTGGIRPQISVDKAVTTPDVMYAAVQEGPFSLPAVPYQKVPKQFRRQIVPDPTGEAPGTIVVSLKDRYLYLVQPGGDAIRYGVGIGKEGFLWSGRANIQYKKAWPRWTPPPEMIQRKPELVKYRTGMEGGTDNPLGARALYIFKDGADTGYRIHGSPEWWSIGQAMSSGCVRLINQDIIDLYNRVPGKAPVVVS